LLTRCLVGHRLLKTMTKRSSFVPFDFGLGFNQLVSTIVVIVSIVVRCAYVKSSLATRARNERIMTSLYFWKGRSNVGRSRRPFARFKVLSHDEQPPRTREVAVSCNDSEYRSGLTCRQLNYTSYWVYRSSTRISNLFFFFCGYVIVILYSNLNLYTFLFLN